MPLKYKRLRRWMVLGLTSIGGLFIWLAPDSTAGIALLVAGVILEAAGIALDRRSQN